MLGDGLQRVAYLVNLAFARGVGKEVELQGAAGRDHAVARTVAGDSRLSGWVLRGSLLCKFGVSLKNNTEINGHLGCYEEFYFSGYFNIIVDIYILI